MKHKTRLFRRIPATTATAHRRSEQAPQPPHAAPVPPAPTGLYAAEHHYLPSTVLGLRAHAEKCLGRVADANTRIEEEYEQIKQCQARIAQHRAEVERFEAEAADHFRLAALAEFDGLAPDDAVVRPGPAMGTDELVNGTQPGFGAGNVRPPMQSTDPDTPHCWLVTLYPTDGTPDAPVEQEMTDAYIEQTAEDFGEDATIEYAREVPWQDGRRHVVRLVLRSREGDGFFVYERAGEQQPSSVADTVTLPQVQEVAR